MTHLGRISAAVFLGLLFMIGANPFTANAEELIAEAEIVGCKDKNISGTGVLIERESAEGIKQVDISLIVKGLKD